MIFPSPEFLFFFLPAVLLFYFACPQSYRNRVLLFTSLLFYFVGGGALVLLLLTSIGVDFIAGRIVAKGRQSSQPRFVRAGILLSVATNLALLGYFKYANFIVEQLNEVGSFFSLGQIAWTSVLLPIGISFYTFQSMSYTIDIARGRAEPVKSIADFALYVSLFPQLIAGPIVRFHEISDEIRSRTTRLDDLSEGVLRFCHGLMKKVVIADSVGMVADQVFSSAPQDLSTAAAWLGVVAYTLQIYFDFSGYSDMAIGLGRIFGFTFPENFRRPYSSVSITDFWRRWHITLSTWLRDYLYVPLGGSRGGTLETYRNLAVVFLLTGLWHGASWTFVIWGAYHGVLLILERLTGQRALDRNVAHGLVRRIYALLAVMIGWVMFRSESLAQAGGIMTAMFTIRTGPLPPEVALSLTTRVQITLVLASLVFLLPRDLVFGISLTKGRSRLVAVGRTALMLIGLPYSLALVSTGYFSPFLYYQF